MNFNFKPSITRNDIVWSLILVILCGVFVLYTLGLTSGVRLDVPFTYDGDGLEYNYLTKTMIETGWWLENPMTGAPGILQMYDYPIGNNLDFLIMKFISVFSDNYAVVMNTYFILGFFLTALCSLYAFRQFRIVYPIAVFGSLIFTFLYYHVSRLGHFNLTSYYMIPLMVMVLLWICQGESLFVRKKVGAKNISFSLTHKGIITIITLLLTATHSYYGYFGLLLLAGSTIWSLSREYSIRDLADGVISIILLGVFIVGNKLPSLIYGFYHGSSYVMSYRYPFETEIWGLKLIQMLLPAPGHRIPFLSHISELYVENRPLVNENVSATLGIVGSVGLIILLFWIFLRGYQPLHTNLSAYAPVMDHLSFLTIGAILVGTIGGFSAIIGQVFPDIHSYNRISVYIAFLAIFAVLILLQIGFLSYHNKSWFCPLFLIVLLVSCTGAILDQIPGSLAFTPNSEREVEFLEQDIFFKKIEDVMPDNAMIFILPDIGGFPHSQNPGKIKNLDSMKPYLHTKTLKWSYPTMKGRFWDNWQVAVASSPGDDVLHHLTMTGFTGLLIDGYGYADNGVNTTSAFSTLTGITPIKSDNNGRYTFFDLTEYMETVQSSVASEEFTASKKAYMDAIEKEPELQNPSFRFELAKNVF
jgi:phosphoglycerol transferase